MIANAQRESDPTVACRLVTRGALSAVESGDPEGHESDLHSLLRILEKHKYHSLRASTTPGVLKREELRRRDPFARDTKADLKKIEAALDEATNQIFHMQQNAFDALESSIKDLLTRDRISNDELKTLRAFLVALLKRV